MKNVAASIKPLFDTVVEIERDVPHNIHKIDGLIRAYNKLLELVKKDYPNHSEDFKNLDDLKEMGSNWNISQANDLCMDLENNLSLMYSIFYNSSIGRASTSNAGISMQQNQMLNQNIEISLMSVSSVDEAISLINQQNIKEDIKEEAKQNLSALETELKKEKPDKSLIKKILAWATSFDKYTGIKVLPFIIKVVLDNWTKIFGT